jgi:5'-3' exonuclease
MPQAKTIALVDVGCLFKRTYEANPNAGGQNTLAEIERVAARVDRVVLCLDYPPYDRKEVFPEYKANRVEPETTEVYQKRWLYDALKSRGYPMARVKGKEGDDVIATLARIYGESWAEVWLVGADKDLAQCVTDNVLQLVPKHGERAEYFRGPKEVKEKFEVTPEQIPLFLALTGDKSDNVPGVPGIGPVKAAGLIGEHKTLAGIAERLATGTGKMWESLRANWNQLHLSLKLTTLDTKLPLDAEALLARSEPVAHPQGEPEFMGNATPMPEPELVCSGTHAPVAAPEPITFDLASVDAAIAAASKPEPLIGKDPRADEFLRQEAAARAEHERERNADRAAREQHEQEEKREEEWRKAKREEFIPFGEPRAAQTAAPFVRTITSTQNGAVPNPPAPVALMPGPVKASLKGLALLRAPFEKHQISKLPKGTKDQNNCPPSEKKNCNVCGGWHHPRIIHLDYVGHAALTDRLLEADPMWTWEPMAVDPKGLPLFDATGGLWIKLTVCGVTRLGYGNAQSKTGADPGSREKEIIGDALRNAAMRFGAALDLWHKGDDLHDEDWDASAAWKAIGGV